MYFYIFLLVASIPIALGSPLDEFFATKCECVLPKYCVDNYADPDQFYGAGLIQVRQYHNKQSECPNPDHICCDNPIDETVVPQYPEQDILENNLDPKPALQPDPRPCGTAATNLISSRITSDSEIASFGELPWMVMMMHKIHESPKHGTHVYRCGGSLIHPRVALTVAHCVHDYLIYPENLVVRAGELDLSDVDEPLGHQERNVEEVLIHENFSVRSLRNDIALVLLERAFDMVPQNVGLMCLPRSPEIASSKDCVVSGWGKDRAKSKDRKSKYSSFLKKVQVPLVSRRYCQRILRQTVLGSRFQLHPSFLCAGGKKDRDACVGDGGSPLICPVQSHPRRYVQLGLVAWGMGCGEENVPGVYVNVYLYRSWVDDKMKRMGLETRFYTI